MLIPIQLFLNELQVKHQPLTVLVLERYMRLRHENLDGARSYAANHHTVYYTYGGPMVLQEELVASGATAACWIELREFDDRFPSATVDGGSDKPLVCVQMGMLDDMFGFVAAQAPNYDELAELFENASIYRHDLADAVGNLLDLQEV